MNDTLVYVDIRGVTTFAGTPYSHRRRNVETSSFMYAADYIGNPHADALDPELPLGAGSFPTRNGASLFGAFGDCAPDRWGRTLVKRRESALAREEGRAAKTLGEVDYLLGVRDDLRQGALRFRVGQTGPFLATDESGVPALTDLPQLMELADRAESDTADLADLQRLIRVGSSLGGARPKAHVRDRNGRISIAKFPSAAHDTWNVMAWEKVALDLAEDAGVVVPTSRLLSLVGRHVLVVERFDRTSDGGRVGYVSAMTMLEASDGDQRSYTEIGDVIERFSSTATAELHQLWRRVAFSVLISNTDDHLLNHGFLHAGGDAWRLAPAFDLNPNPDTGARHLATAINNSDDEADLGLLLSVTRSFRLSEPQGRSMLLDVAAVVGQWRDVAARLGLAPKEVESMSPAFRRVREAAEM